MPGLVSVKSVIDKLEAENRIPIGYVSFRQGYLNNKVTPEAAQYIQEVKKFMSVSYYINEADVDKFAEALYKQFN